MDRLTKKQTCYQTRHLASMCTNRMPLACAQLHQNPPKAFWLCFIELVEDMAEFPRLCLMTVLRNTPSSLPPFLLPLVSNSRLSPGTDVPNRDRRSLGSLGGSFVTPFAARRTRRGAIILSQQEISEFEENTARNMLPWIGQPLLLTEPRGFPSLFHLVDFGVFSAY